MQAGGQPRQRVDLYPDVGGAGPPVARQFLGCPPLGRLAQPRLGDTGERQSPGMAEDRQVPDVVDLFAAGVGQGPDPGQGRAGAATDDVAVVTADLPG